MSRGKRSDPAVKAEKAPRSRHLAVFVEDRALWPLLIIFVIHIGLGGALLLLAAFRDANLPAQAALAILVTLSGDAIRRAQHRRRVAFWLALLWTLSLLIAGGSAYLGLL